MALLSVDRRCSACTKSSNLGGSLPIDQPKKGEIPGPCLLSAPKSSLVFARRLQDNDEALPFSTYITRLRGYCRSRGVAQALSARRWAISLKQKRFLGKDDRKKVAYVLAHSRTLGSGIKIGSGLSSNWTEKPCWSFLEVLSTRVPWK